MSFRVDLLSAATATGSAANWPGGMGVFTVAPIDAGATVTLQYLGPDSTTWIAAGTDTTLTATGGARVYLAPGQVRALVTGGPPTAVYAALIRQLP